MFYSSSKVYIFVKQLSILPCMLPDIPRVHAVVSSGEETATIFTDNLLKFTSSSHEVTTSPALLSLSIPSGLREGRTEGERAEGTQRGERRGKRRGDGMQREEG